MPTAKPRVTFTISKERLSELEAYQHDNKIKNQTQAILSLIEKGLSDFETRKKETPLYTSEALKLAKDYDKLDSYGKRVVRLVADAEVARCAEQARAGSLGKLYIAARDGSRLEVEAADDLTIPEESADIPE